MDKLNNSLSIKEICEALNVAAPLGQETIEITAMANLDLAVENQITFVDRDSFVEQAEASPASLILSKKGLNVKNPAAVEVEDLWGAVAAVLNLLHPGPVARSFVHRTAVVAKSASLGEDVYIGPNVVVGEYSSIGARTRLDGNCFLGDNVLIGEDCRLFPQVTLLDQTELGNRVVLHTGVSIGSDGFRYEASPRGAIKIPQVGKVVIEDDVEIGANSTVDCAFLHETRIGARTKLDNLVHLGHNVQVGTDCIIVAQVGVGGSTEIGAGTMIGGQTGINQHVKIGPQCRIAGQSGVHKDLPAGSRVIGTPVVDEKTFALYTIFMKDFRKHWKLIKTFTGK